MKKRKATGLLLSLAIVLGVALPGTMAMPTDADEGSQTKYIGTDSNSSSDADNGSQIENENITIVVETDSNASSDKENNDDKGTGELPVEQEIATDSNAKKPVNPGIIVHIDTCLEGCTGENCNCPCHNTLFARLMAAETLEELFAIVDETAEEDLLALTDEEVAQVEAKIVELEPEPLPEIIINGPIDGSSDEPVISEIIYPTVNFDNVAPFGDPVVG